MENQFSLLNKEQLSLKNREVFEKMEKNFGKVPNLYNVIAYSEHALDAYIKLEETPNSLTPKEVEAVNLVVSQVNQCLYCLSAHTIIARTTGITEEDSREIRLGKFPAEEKIDALVKLTEQITLNRGHVKDNALEKFFEVGYTKENLVDLILLIGDRTISNLLYAVTEVPIDFPIAKSV